MRLAVLADVHANLPALEAVLADLRPYDVDGIIVAGDHVTTGPYPTETLRLLRALGCWLIRGNTDNYLLAYDAGDVPDSWNRGDQWAALRWVYRRLDRETLDWLASLPEQRVIALDGTAPIRVVHGSPSSPSEHLFPDRDPATLRLFQRAGFLPADREPVKLDLALAQIDEPVLVCGHSHIPWHQEQAGRLALNPGSVGFPIDGSVCAQYALLAWRDDRWQARLQAVPYDMDEIRAAYRESGLLAEGGSFTRAWVLGMETGQNISGRLVAYAHRLAAEIGFEGGDLPDAIWEQAVATFDWEAATRL